MNGLLRCMIVFAFLGCEGSAEETVGGVNLPDTRGTYQLQGAGLLRKGLVFKIYVGALYLADAGDALNILGEVPKRLDIHYFHRTPKKHMIRTANQALQKNLSQTQYAALKPKIDKLHVAFLDGRKGSYASILYEPGKGLAYWFDGEPVITIPGDEFANAYFSIWLGENPSSASMKKALLNLQEDE